MQSIRRIDVYRVAERTDAPLPLTEEEFSARATLIGSVPAEEIKPGRDTLTFTDTLALTEPVRLRYALRYVNAAGQRAAFSNFLLVEPASRISQPPVLTSVMNSSETAILIRWQTPAANVDGSTPVNLLGYNLYRTDRSQNEPGQTSLNKSLINPTETSYSDQTFSFGEEYVYLVRAVSLGTGGAQVESLNSNALSITPQDVFPPAAPGPISPIAAPGKISLFWPANQERDVAGYNIYRATDPNLPKDKWTKLNRTLYERTTYLDEAVEAGTRYYYYLLAVDTAGNVSPPSEVVSEVVP